MIWLKASVSAEHMNLLQSCVNELLEQIYQLPGFEKSE